jgi:hypothetical protein
VGQGRVELAVVAGAAEPMDDRRELTQRDRTAGRVEVGEHAGHAIERGHPRPARVVEGCDAGG